MNNDVALEKHVIALNESLINFFKGFIFRIGAHPLVSNGYTLCQICGSTDHTATTCPHIDLKLKCVKCGHLHKTKVCGVRCGYFSSIGHIKYRCWKHGKYGKAPFVANNYLESLVMMKRRHWNN
jgi:hypothetical protein